MIVVREKRAPLTMLLLCTCLKDARAVLLKRASRFATGQNCDKLAAGKERTMRRFGDGSRARAPRHDNYAAFSRAQKKTRAAL